MIVIDDRVGFITKTKCDLPIQCFILDNGALLQPKESSRMMKCQFDLFYVFYVYFKLN